MKFKLKVRETFDLDKKTTEFIKKIEYVIGAIEHESKTSESSWDIRVGEVRIQKFRKMLANKLQQSIADEFNNHLNNITYEYDLV